MMVGWMDGWMESKLVKKTSRDLLTTSLHAHPQPYTVHAQHMESGYLRTKGQSRSTEAVCV